MAKKSVISKDNAILFSIAFGLISGVFKLIFWIVSALVKLFFPSGNPEYLKNEKILRDNLSLLYRINYSDADGEETTRDVDIKRILGSKKYTRYIQGYCHLRREPRSFKIERISSFIDLHTGLVVEGRKAVFSHFISLSKGGEPFDGSFLRTFPSPVPVVFTLADGKVFEAQVENIEQDTGRLRIKTQAKRVGGKKAWSGSKTFYPNEVSALVRIEYNEQVFSNIFDFLDVVLNEHQRAMLQRPKNIHLTA